MQKQPKKGSLQGVSELLSGLYYISAGGEGEVNFFRFPAHHSASTSHRRQWPHRHFGCGRRWLGFPTAVPIPCATCLQLAAGHHVCRV